MTCNDIFDKINNWFIYLKNLPRVGPIPDTTCRSIEHRYIPEAGEVFDEEKNEEEFYDLEQAERMEKAVCKLPKEYKKIIVYRFVKFRYLSDRALAKKFKLRKHEFQKKVSLSLELLKRLLNDDGKSTIKHR